MQITQITKLSLLALSSLLVSGCVSATTAQQAVMQTPLQNQQVMPQGSYSEAEIAQLLAPIALYPDSLLSHILIAATYPLEVIQAERWLSENPTLTGTAAVEAAADKPWDPSVIALTATPAVLKRMSDDIAWTQNLGEAVLTDEEQVLAGIQVLREQAYAEGQLASNEHVVIEREQANKTIVIETVKREYIYVPYYDPRVVYGSWRWYEYPPIYWPQPALSVSIGSGWGSGIYWGISYHVPSAFYFSYMAWPQRYIVVNHHYYHKPQRRHPHRYHVIDQGKRWQHNPEHRRGVAYKHRDLQRDQPTYKRVSRDWQRPQQPVGERQRKQPIDRRELDRRALATRLRQSPVVEQPQQVKQPPMTTTPIAREISDGDRDRPRQRVVQQRQQREQRPITQPRQRPVRETPVGEVRETPVRETPVQRPQKYREPPMTTTPIERTVRTPQYTAPVQQPQVRQPVRQQQVQPPVQQPQVRQQQVQPPRQVVRPQPPVRERDRGTPDKRAID